MDTVEKWMLKNPVSIDENAASIEAMHLMKEKEIRRLPETREGKCAGIIMTTKMLEALINHCRNCG